MTDPIIQAREAAARYHETRKTKTSADVAELIRQGEFDRGDAVQAALLAIQASSAETDRLREEVKRLTSLTTRFPDLMERIVAAKDEPLEPRVARLMAAMQKLPDCLHDYQWEADERQLFGSKWVRTVAGNNGHGMGRQAIAETPYHIEGLAEFIAAANPDTIAMMLAALASLPASEVSK